MLWSQFSAIFPNFWRKNWRFRKTNVMIKFFSKFSFVLSQKRQFLANFFGENILKIITSVPGLSSLPAKKYEKSFFLRNMQINAAGKEANFVCLWPVRLEEFSVFWQKGNSSDLPFT
jgi:hypothetical protein